MTNPSEKRVLVTGASGFVGNNLVRQLVRQGRCVRALVNQYNESLEGLDIERVSGDVLSKESIEQALENVDVVYHLAAVVSIDTDRESQRRMNDVNVRGTQCVANACLNKGIRRLVHFSSVHALSYATDGKPIDENCPLASDLKYHGAYDLSKSAAEKIILQATTKGLDAVILNPVGIIGPNDYQPSPSGEMLLQLARRKLPGLVRSGFHWVDVRDVVDAAIAAEESGRSGERYILSSQFATFESIAKWVHEETGARPPWFNSPLWLARVVAPMAAGISRMTGSRPLITSSSIKTLTFQNDIATDKARDELGFRTRAVEMTVKDTVRWLLQHHSSATGEKNV